MHEAKDVANCDFCKAPHCKNRDTGVGKLDRSCFMMEDEFICDFCPRSDYCVKKGTKIAKYDRSCFEETVCALCEARFFCQNPQKDRKPINLSAWKVDEDGLPACFVSSHCGNCPVAASGQCKNKGLGKPFVLRPVKSSKPTCFSGQHSVR